MPYMVERIVHCHVVLPVLLVADSAYHNAVGRRCIGGGLLTTWFLCSHPGGGVLSKILKVNGYFLFENKGVGVSRANFEKYLGIFLLFHLHPPSPNFTGSGNGFGSGTGDRAWYRFRYRCEIQFRSGPSSYFLPNICSYTCLYNI